MVSDNIEKELLSYTAQHSEMNETKCGGLILDTIDQLRKRKARPDFDRICHMLARRHGLKRAAVTDELNRLVNERKVIKVDYKGSTSYRNAAKWIKTKTQFHGSCHTSSDLSTVVLDAVRVLTIPAEGQQQLRSASVQDIEQYLLKADSQFSFNPAMIRAYVDKEVVKGNLHQLPSGEYIPLKIQLSENVSNEETSSNSSKSDGVPPAKSWKPVNDAKSPEATKDPKPNRCDYCLLTASANRKGEPEDLLVCKDCSSKAHPSCMEYTKLLPDYCPLPRNWQCPDCKTCIVCDETAGSNDLLTCYMCFEGYHMNCHEPRVTIKPSGVWLCSDCETNTKTETDDESYEPNVSYQSSNDGFLKSIQEYPASIPLAKKWSIGNVEAFIRHLGYDDEASAFREQEIDGMSLLLMKRNDVLTGLGIKLGPALKIYKHIVKLQCN
ncbi:histone acetyltransferase KAT6B-like [Uloborus diversus]|uniref:histone acetyltransferase KAT6B-like n=1 Tax=Uloborus diversus TaxID=327109 RepID=UPI002409C1FE|nr:histone acetyltransferase KAT6B-like [Uloborus diversus]